MRVAGRGRELAQTSLLTFAGASVGLLFGCVCGIFALLVVLLIYSVLLRLSVWVANKCLGDSGGGSRRRDDYEDDWDDYDRPARRRGPAIPEPDLGKGMGIAFLVIVIQFVIVFALALVIGVGLGAAGGGAGAAAGAARRTTRSALSPAWTRRRNCCSTASAWFSGS